MRGAGERYGGGGPTASSRPRGHAALAVAATCLLAVLVAWAALIGPEQVFTGPGPTPSTERSTPTPTPDEGGTAPAPPEDRELPGRPPWWVGALLWLLAAAIVLGALLGLGFILWWLWSLWRSRRRDELEPLRADFQTLAPGARVQAAVRADAETQDAVLQEGTPRNAIVAAWHRFELQGERAGLPRSPSETSSEFIVRVLDVLNADSAAVLRLGELYREARFSRHELGEHHRAAAVEALAAIRASLGSTT